LVGLQVSERGKEKRRRKFDEFGRNSFEFCIVQSFGPMVVVNGSEGFLNG
jgi:hypothetical protein